MAGYVFNTNLPYEDYLQAEEFRKDVTGALENAGRFVSMSVSHQTREIIASQESLAREQIEAQHDAARQQSKALGKVKESLDAGFETLRYGLSDVSSGIAELDATFHWGFSSMCAQLGRMNDTLHELVRIAKTPVQTVAFEHFEIARDAFRQGFYREALEELAKATGGDHTSAGYKMEWRFHHLRGLIRLGFVDGDMDLVDLAEAEEAFLTAARYAKMDYPEDSGRAFLSAGWAAYCQGRMPEALTHTELAMKAHPGLGEAFFQASKVLMAMNRPEQALPYLGQAIGQNLFFALKASGDGDFQKHGEILRDFLEGLRREKIRQLKPYFATILKCISNRHLCVTVLGFEETFRALHKEFESLSLMDLEHIGLNLVSASEGIWTEIEKKDSVLLRPAGFFRKAQYRKSMPLNNEMNSLAQPKCAPLEIHTIGPLGKPIVRIEFIRIPAGRQQLGRERYEYEFNSFLLGRYPVTQAQWKAVMGENPSSHKGDDHPVTHVSREKIYEFLYKLNSSRKFEDQLYCLPSHLEWEYACRAGAKTKFCFGDDEDMLTQYAWYKKNSGGTTHPVGQKLPNMWGLYDMHGNVKEDVGCGAYGGCYYDEAKECGCMANSCGDRSMFGGFRLKSKL